MIENKFNKKSDRICLITQNIPIEHAYALNQLHEKAQGSVNANDFIIKTNQERIANNKTRDAFEIIKGIITNELGSSNYLPTIQITNSSKDIVVEGSESRIGGNGFDTYEEAVEHALQYAIKNYKNLIK